MNSLQLFSTSSAASFSSLNLRDLSVAGGTLSGFVICCRRSCLLVEQLLAASSAALYADRGTFPLYCPGTFPLYCPGTFPLYCPRDLSAILPRDISAVLSTGPFRYTAAPGHFRCIVHGTFPLHCPGTFPLHCHCPGTFPPYCPRELPAVPLPESSRYILWSAVPPRWVSRAP